MMNRRTAVVAVLLFALGLFAGCGEASPTPAAPPNEKQKQKEGIKPGGPADGGPKKK